MKRIRNLIRNLNYLSKHSLWDQRETDILYLTNKIIDDVKYEYGLCDTNDIKVLSADESMEVLAKQPKSFVRIGDGEIRLILGEDQPFQQYDPILAKILKEEVSGRAGDIYVGLNYAYFSPFPFNYVRRNAYDFRLVLEGMCDKSITYIDAGVTNAQIPYKSKSEAEKYVNWWRHFFEKKELVIVCGDHLLDDYSYNIFDQASSIEYIYGPRKNAWTERERIIEDIVSYDTSKWIVFILGMAGKGMIPELTNKGYYCLDIGHLAKYYNSYMEGATWTEEYTKKFYSPD